MTYLQAKQAEPSTARSIMERRTTGEVWYSREVWLVLSGP